MPSVFFIGKIGIEIAQGEMEAHELAGQHQAPSLQARDGGDLTSLPTTGARGT